MFVSVEEARMTPPALIDKLIPGEEIVLTRDDKPVAKLTAIPQQPLKPRVPGSAKGQLIIHAKDDEHLKDFAEYM